jgi:hypothetical protein
MTDLASSASPRTDSGAPRHWSSPAVFGVLLSSSDGVTARTFDPHTETWSPMTTAAAAGAHGLAVCSVQPGLEFETMRLEGRTWRDFWGRTPREVITARWARP